jgi:hypothetical protein
MIIGYFAFDCCKLPPCASNYWLQTILLEGTEQRDDVLAALNEAGSYLVPYGQDCTSSSHLRNAHGWK